MMKGTLYSLIKNIWEILSYKALKHHLVRYSFILSNILGYAPFYTGPIKLNFWSQIIR